MSKVLKRARVRYDDGKESGKERYILETYDPKDGLWAERMVAPFVTSAEHPEAGRNFIHYTLLTEALNLAEHGYSVEI